MMQLGEDIVWDRAFTARGGRVDGFGAMFDETAAQTVCVVSLVGDEACDPAGGGEQVRVPAAVDVSSDFDPSG